MAGSDDNLLRFPQSRVRGPGARRPVKVIGMTKLAESINPSGNGAMGHWCSRCKGVWFGCGGETECPACGNRHG